MESTMDIGLFLTSFQIYEHFRKDGDVVRVPVGLPESHFAVLLSGEADFISKEGTVHLAPGDLLYLPMNLPYRSEWHGDAKFLSLYFTFSSFIETSRFKLQKLTFSDKYTDKMQDIFRAEGEGNGALALSLFYGFYDECTPHLIPQVKRFGESSVLPAILYLQSHSREPISVSDLAAMCSMSESYFFSCFKHQTGTSPIDYKNTVRCRLAAEMLCHSDRTVEDIAGDLGFSSPQYLRKLLFSVYGKTPKEIRKEHPSL